MEDPDDTLPLPEQVLLHLARIERRLPGPEGEFPIDRHLREIRDNMSELREQMNNLFYIRRNGSGRDGLVPGLNRVEDRVDTILRVLSILGVSFLLAGGALLVTILVERAAKP